MPDGSALRGKHVLVTGATTPLARSLAVVLAEAGATVSVTTSSANLVEEVRANSILNETWSAGSQGRAETVDLADGPSVESVIAKLESAVAPIDALVNLVAVPVDAEAVGAESACRAAATRMATRGAGRIVNVVPPDAAPEVRDAVLAVSRHLSAEWGTRGIAVYTLTVDGPEDVEAPATLVALAAGIGDLAAYAHVTSGDAAAEPPPRARPPIVRPPAGAPGPTWGGDGALRDEIQAARSAPLSPTASVPASGRQLPVAGALPAGLELASFPRRAAAWLIDYTIKLVLLVIALSVAGIPEAGVPLTISLRLFVAVQLLWRGYEFLFFKGGRTPGGLLLGLRVVRVEDGGEPGVGRALLRTFGAFLSEQAFLIGFAWALRSPLRQGWPDAIAGTLVVRASRPRRR